MMSRDESFETEEEDEFMKYYRKFRSPTSSSASFNSSQTSSSPLQRQRNSRRSWYNPKKLLNFKYSKKRSPQRRPYSSTSTSPLQGLAGMLSDKMTFYSEHSRDDQSRGSGNSSGGSPDWRGGVRKRRTDPGTILAQPSASSTSYVYHQQLLPPPPPSSVSELRRDWHRRPSSDQFDELNSSSIYSYYETARDLMDPADIILQSALETRRSKLDSVSNSIYNDYSSKRESSDFYNNTQLTLVGNHLASWHVEGLCEDNSNVTSDSGNRQTNKDTLEIKSGTKEKWSLGLCLLCYRIYVFFKFLLMTLSLLLLFFAIAFIMRSMSCEKNRQNHFDLEQISQALETSVFGQFNAIDEIMNSLSNFDKPELPSVLVLILVGWLGNGKTLATSVLENNFPVRENVHSFSVTLHFGRDTENFHFLDDLSLLIAQSCGYSMVVFDDIDEGSDQALEKIERFISSLKNSQLSSRSNGTLVVVTSNAGGTLINQFTHEFIMGGEARDNITVQALVKHLQNNKVQIPTEAFLKANEIQLKVVPFLPLTVHHVVQCIRKEITDLHLTANQKDIENILTEVPFFTPDLPILSKVGCKQVAAKVNLFLGSQDNQYLSK